MADEAASEFGLPEDHPLVEAERAQREPRLNHVGFGRWIATLCGAKPPDHRSWQLECTEHGQFIDVYDLDDVRETIACLQAVEAAMVKDGGWRG